MLTISNYWSDPGHASLQEAQKFLASEDNTAHHKAMMFLRSALRDMGEELAGNLLEYNISAMIVAMISMAVVSLKHEQY